MNKDDDETAIEAPKMIADKMMYLRLPSLTSLYKTNKNIAINKDRQVFP